MSDLQSEYNEISPKISVGVVVFNGVEHIRRALGSVVGQPYKNIELIIIDGGSADGTLKILSEYSQYITVLVSEPDKGIYDAMNKVCSLATGDWLLFLGCDDMLLDTFGKIAVMLKRPDTVYHADVIKRSSGRIYGGEFSKYRLLRYNFCHQALFYPRIVYKKYSYRLDYRWLADWAYNLKLLGDKVPFVYAEVVVSIFNDEGGSAPGDADFARDQIKLIRDSFGNTYVLILILRNYLLWLRNSCVSAFGVVLKRLLPYSYWKYLQSLWRRTRK